MFDFDATLPFMALQFLLLAAVLNAIFYKPLTKVLDDRDSYIRTNTLEAKESLAKAELEAKKITAEKIAEAQKEAQSQREQASVEIEQQKQEAFRTLEQQVDALSRQILEKLLGPTPVR